MSRLVITLLSCPKLLLLVLMLMFGARTRVSGAPQCPPGGRWFDKHVGQWGRWACCSELCEPPGFFTSNCNKKCPDYEELKARAAAEVTVDLATQEKQSEPQPPQASTKAASHESANNISISTILVAVIGITIVATIIIFAVFVHRRETRLGERERGGADIGQEETTPMKPLGNANAQPAQPNGPNTSRTGRPEAQDDRRSLANSNTPLLPSSGNGRSQTDLQPPVMEGGAREGAHDSCCSSAGRFTYEQTAKEAGSHPINVSDSDPAHSVRAARG